MQCATRSSPKSLQAYHGNPVLPRPETTTALMRWHTIGEDQFHSKAALTPQEASPVQGRHFATFATCQHCFSLRFLETIFFFFFGKPLVKLKEPHDPLAEGCESLSLEFLYPVVQCCSQWLGRLEELCSRTLDGDVLQICVKGGRRPSCTFYPWAENWRSSTISVVLLCVGFFSLLLCFPVIL